MEAFLNFDWLLNLMVSDSMFSWYVISSDGKITHLHAPTYKGKEIYNKFRV